MSSELPTTFLDPNRYTLNEELTAQTLEALRRAASATPQADVFVPNDVHALVDDIREELCSLQSSEPDSLQLEFDQESFSQETGPTPGVDALRQGISLHASRGNNAYTELIPVRMSLGDNTLSINTATGNKPFAVIYLHFATCSVVRGLTGRRTPLWRTWERKTSVQEDKRGMVEAKWCIEVRHVSVEYADNVVWLAFGGREDVEDWKEVLDGLMK